MLPLHPIRARTTRAHARLAAAAILLLAPAAFAVVDQSQVDAAGSLFADKKFAEAAGAYARLGEQLGPEQTHLAPTLGFNRGCAQLAAGDAAAAEKTFLEVDASATDLSVRAAARYNLGQIVAKRAESLAEKQPDQAIETYRQAERHFRNALADQPGNADAAHNVEVVQRAIAKLQEQQKQQQQQQQQQKNNDQKQKDQQDKNEQNQDDKKQDQDQNKKDDKSDKQKQDQQKQHPSDPSQQGKDQNKDIEGNKTDQKKQAEQDQQKSEQQQQNTGGQDEQRQNQDQQAQQQQQQAKAGDQREFDRTAAQILDKERQQRERLKHWLQLMRARAAPVEKDW